MKIALVLCLLSVLVLSSCSDSSAPPEDKPVYTGQLVPMQVGNYWAYLGTIYNPDGTMNSTYPDTITILSKTSFRGFDAYYCREKSVGGNDFLYYYDHDTLNQVSLPDSGYISPMIYPMTEGQEIILAENTQQNYKLTLKLDSLATPVDMGFEKFTGLKYRTTQISSGATLTVLDYYELGFGQLKHQVYNNAGVLMSKLELVGYHVVK
ncbi:MAG TPA: hypothetical protein VFO76_03530 [Candidatus Kapabacteria bacterium]|nr:hypothetical protein [Candidatus Kapabacteria bacterium]